MLLPLTHKRSVQMWHKKRQGEAARLEFTLLLLWEVCHYHHVSGLRLQGQAMSEPWCLMTLMRKPVLLMTSVKKPWLPVHLVSASRDSDEWPTMPLQLMATNDLLDHQLPQDLKVRFKLADIHSRLIQSPILTQITVSHCSKPLYFGVLCYGVEANWQNHLRKLSFRIYYTHTPLPGNFTPGNHQHHEQECSQ